MCGRRFRLILFSALTPFSFPQSFFRQPIDMALYITIAKLHTHPNITASVIVQSLFSRFSRRIVCSGTDVLSIVYPNNIFTLIWLKHSPTKWSGKLNPPSLLLASTSERSKKINVRDNRVQLLKIFEILRHIVLGEAYSRASKSGWSK